MAAYATREELATFMEIEEAELPVDVERLLQRATDLIDYVILNNDATSYTTELSNAACAQCEWWINTGDELGIDGLLSSLSLGDFSASFGSGQGGSQVSTPWGAVCQRAYQYLFRAGLLYRGVAMR